MSGENPYAAPAVAEVSAPPSGLSWRMDGTGLLVKAGTVLPPIDLETGASGVDGAELMPVMRRRQARSGSLFGLAFIVVIVFSTRAMNESFSGMFPWLLLGYVILSLFGPFKAKVLTIWEQREKRREAARRRRMWFRVALFASAPVVMLGSFKVGEIGGFDHRSSLLLGGFVVCHLLIVLAVVLGMIDRPRTSLASAGDGWLRLDRLHPDAVTGLFAIQQNERARIAEEGGVKSWNVYTVFAQKLGLRFLIDRDTKPLLAVNLFILRMTRSRHLEMTLLAPEEAEDVPAESLRAELQEELAAWRERHPEWSLLATERLSAPFCMVEQEFAVLVDSGSRHVAVLSATWARANPTAVRCRVQLHGWRSDGHLIATIDQPIVETGRTEASYQEVKAPPAEVLRRHLERCAGTDLIALTPEDISQRLTRERDAVIKILQDLGYYGPLRTVTLTSPQ